MKYVYEGSLVDTWGAGYFIALDLSDNNFSDYTSVMAGMEPSMGSGLGDIKSDPDHNIIAKVTDKLNQKFVVVSTNSSGTRKDAYDLSMLELVKN